jgi:hypothetical protein
MAQKVSCQTLTAKARIQFQISPSGDFREPIGTWKIFFTSKFVLLCQKYYILHTHLHLMLLVLDEQTVRA